MCNYIRMFAECCIDTSQTVCRSTFSPTPPLCAQSSSTPLVGPLIGLPRPSKCPRCCFFFFLFFFFFLQPRLVQDVQAALPASDPWPPSWCKPAVWKLHSARRLSHRGPSQLHDRAQVPPAAPHEGRPSFKTPVWYERWELWSRYCCCAASLHVPGEGMNKSFSLAAFIITWTSLCDKFLTWCFISTHLWWICMSFVKCLLGL